MSDSAGHSFVLLDLLAQQNSYRCISRLEVCVQVIAVACNQQIGRSQSCVYHHDKERQFSRALYTDVLTLMLHAVLPSVHRTAGSLAAAAALSSKMPPVEQDINKSSGNKTNRERDKYQHGAACIDRYSCDCNASGSHNDW